MKNKYYNRIMLPAVVLIWAFALWRIFGPEPEEPSINLPTQALPAITLAVSEEPDTLRLGYRDPFLDRRPVRQAPASNPSPQPTISVIKPASTINYPEVRYLGGVASADGLITGVMQLGSAFYNVQQGDSLAGLWVRSLSLDASEVQFADSVWVVRK